MDIIELSIGLARSKLKTFVESDNLFKEPQKFRELLDCYFQELLNLSSV